MDAVATCISKGLIPRAGSSDARSTAIFRAAASVGTRTRRPTASKGNGHRAEVDAYAVSLADARAPKAGVISTPSATSSPSRAVHGRSFNASAAPAFSGQAVRGRDAVAAFRSPIARFGGGPMRSTTRIHI